MWKTILGFGGKALGLLGVGTVAAVGDQVATGGKITQSLVGEVGGSLAQGQNRAKTEGTMDWLARLAEMLSRILKATVGESGLTKSLDRFSHRMDAPAGSAEASATGGRSGPGGNDPSGTNPDGPKGALSNDPDNIGLSFGQTAGVAGIAALGAKAVGTRAIPVVGGVVAGVDTIADVATLSLRGEWKAAGVRTLSGVVDTVGSSFGFLGMAFGAAGREAIEAGGEKLLGQEAHLGDGDLVTLAKTGARLVLGR